MVSLRNNLHAAAVLPLGWWKEAIFKEAMLTNLRHLSVRQVLPELCPEVLLCFLQVLFLGQRDVVQLYKRDNSSQFWLMLEK